MTSPEHLQWPLVIGLGALALVRPLTMTVRSQLDLPGSPVIAIGLTVLVSAVWVAVVGLTRVAHPVLTLLAAALVYAVLSTVFSAVASPILTGELQGPLAMPWLVVPILATNAVWGAVTGALALLVQLARGGSTAGPGRYGRAT